MTAIVRPVRLQLSRKRGFNLQALSLATNGSPAVNVARPSKWGNDFYIAPDGKAAWAVYDETGLFVAYADTKREAREIAVEKFCALVEAEFAADPQAAELVLKQLRGRNVACWCALDGGPCHANVWLELANPIICEGV